MPRRVQPLPPPHCNGGPQLRDPVHHAHHPRLVARDHLGGVQDQVVLVELQVLAAAKGGQVEGSSGLRLEGKRDS